MNQISSKAIYNERIHLAIDYISTHLAEEINLEKLSSIACFSPYHFHRVFKAITDETPHDYIERVRLERAANKLFLHPNKSVTEIAEECGYSSVSLFSRSFKKHYSISPRHFFRKHVHDFHSQNNIQEADKPRGVNNDLSSIKITQLPDYYIIYVETLDGYRSGIPHSWNRLGKYASVHGLFTSETLFIGLPFDNPGITPLKKCRYRACITVSEEYCSNVRDVKRSVIRGGRYAIYHFRGSREEISDGYAFLYGEWLPQSGFIPDDKPLLEIYPPELHSDTYFEILEYDIALPVNPL